MRNRIPANVLNGQVAASARAAGFYAMPECGWSIAEDTVAKRTTQLTKDHGKRPEEAPTG